MKKLKYIACLFLLLVTGMLYGQTTREIYSIQTGSSESNNYYCVRNSSGQVKVYFKWKGTRANPDNKFIAELSDANGNFGSPIKLGEITERGNQVSVFEILFNLPAGTDGLAYKIRIRSTSPEVIGVSAPFEAHHLGDATPTQLNNFNNVELCPGAGGRTISVTGGSTAAVYKWYKDGQLIPGATGSSYTVTTPGVYAVDPDFGRCSTSLRSNQVTATLAGSSGSMVLKIKGASPREICAGVPTTLETEVENGGSNTFTYQWYKGEVAITGASTATYNVTEAGDYKVTATAAGACPLTSNVIKVTERNTAGLLTISGGETQVKCPAQTITLTSALSNPSLTGIYKWYKNNTEISGASTNTYTVSDTGSYYVTLTETDGCVIKSNTVTVTDRSGVNPGDIKWLGHENNDVVFSFPYRRPVIELDIPSTETLTVKWFKEDDPSNILQENTTRSFQVPSEGTFVAEVYDACGTKVSTSVLKLQVKEPSRYIPTIGFKQGNAPCGASQAILELSKLEAVIVVGSEQKKTLVPNADYDQYTFQWKKDGVAVGSGKELSVTTTNTVSVYHLMVSGAFNSNEIKLMNVDVPTAISITTSTGATELESDRALELIPTLSGNFQQELFTYKWYHRKDNTQPWEEKKDVTGETDKKYVIPATSQKDPAFRSLAGEYQFVAKLKEGNVSIGGQSIDLTPYAAACGGTEGVINIRYVLNYDGVEVPNILLLRGEDLNRKWILPSQWAGAKVTIYKQTGEIVYQANQYNNDFPNFESIPSREGAAIYFFYELEKDGKTQRGTITIFH